MKEKKTPWYKKRRTIVIAILVVILFLVGRKLTAGTPKVLETSAVSRGTVKEELVLSGEIKATHGANLAFQTGGKLAWVGVKTGDWVRKGQALEQLDTTSLNASYQVARSSLLASEANVNYIHDTLKDKGDSETFLEKNTRVAAEVAHDNAYESMIAAQKSLRDATLLAPFEGLVTGVANEVPGMNISIGSSQVALVDPSTIYFSVTADQTDVARFSVDQEAHVVFDAFPELTILGKISTISFTPSTEDTGTVYPMRVQIIADNSKYKYRIGMTGDARFILSQKDNVLFVPTKFIKSDKTGKYLLVNSGKDKKYIEVGIEGDETTEIKGDITEGTKIFD